MTQKIKGGKRKDRELELQTETRKGECYVRSNDLETKQVKE